MKTRIISGTFIVLISALVLGLTIKYSPVIVVASAILAAVAVYEALYSTGIAKSKAIVSVAIIYSVITVCRPLLYEIPTNSYLINAILKNVVFSQIPIIAFALIMFALYLKFHSNIKLEGMLGMIILPIAISYGFSSFSTITLVNQQLFYVVLVLCWSAIADTGAYFVGVTIGKHKMAPVISPKKSWEGLIGGIIISLLAVFGVCALYNKVFGSILKTPFILAITPIFVLIGVLGDLTASLIKRKCGIKDFGKLIPGHGGILDRFDSILMISAALSPILNILPFNPIIK